MESKPRLTYITTSSFPARKASSVQVMQMCAAFAAAGALVKLVARRTASQEDVFAYYGVTPTFTFEARPFSPWPRPTDLFQMQAVLAEPGTNWICYARGQDSTAPLVALGRGAWALLEAHGRPATLRQRLAVNWIARHPRGRLIVISESLQEIYRREFGLRSFVAPDGVDLSRFAPPRSATEARRQLGLENEFWVVYVGGLYPGRGLETLFTAVADLPVHVLLVGGRDEVELALWHHQARAAGVRRIRFEGYQPPGRVPLYLFAADVLVMPYSASTRTPSGEDTTAWMSPLKLYEYLAAGRPIVATNLPALCSVLTHEQNALLAQPDDAEDLRAAIQRLWADPALADRLAANARQTAQAHAWVSRAKSILELLPRD